MGTILTKDRTELYYKDWGAGQPIVFSHGWPLNSDVWDNQMLFLASRGYRCIAYDRRGHGRSSQPWTGNDMNTYADDLSELVEVLDVRDAIHVGVSTGACELVRYLGRFDAKRAIGRAAKIVLIGAVLPLALKSSSNPAGIPMEVFDEFRRDVLADRSQYFKNFAVRYYGADRPGSNVSPGILDWFWLMAMQAGFRAVLDSIKAFSETDFSEDLKRIDVPTLIVHGDDDQVVPIASSALRSHELIRNSQLKIYKGAPHGLCWTHRDQLNHDLLSFIAR